MFSSSYHRATQSFFPGYNKADDVVGTGSSCPFGGSCHPEDAPSALCYHLAFSESQQPWGAASAAAPAPVPFELPHSRHVVCCHSPRSPQLGDTAQGSGNNKISVTTQNASLPERLSILTFLLSFAVSPRLGHVLRPSSGAPRGAHGTPSLPPASSCSQDPRGSDSHPIPSPTCVTKAKSQCYLSKLLQFCFQASQLALLSQ